MKKIIKSTVLFVLLVSFTNIYSDEKYDLSTPENVISLFFQMKKENIDIAKNIFIDDYQKIFDKFDDKMHEEKYKIIKIFQSNSGQNNLFISLVKVKSDGTLYYILYFLKNDFKFKIYDLDRVLIPNPSDHPDIEQQLISTLKNNAKAFKIKQE